jgi:hypothetical protein
VQEGWEAGVLEVDLILILVLLAQMVREVAAVLEDSKVVQITHLVKEVQV